MKVLFVSESVWMQGVVYDLHVLAEGLSLLGHEVYAIDPGGWSSESRFGLAGGEARDVARVYPEARVHLRSPRFPRLPTLGPLPVAIIPGLGFLLGVFSRYSEIRRTVRDEKIDVIVLYSALNSGLQTVRLARRFKIPVVFRNVDILHNLSPTPMIRTLVKILEKRVYPRVDSVLALTPKYAEYLKNMGARESDTKLLLFPIDTELFRPGVDHSEVQQKWRLGEKDQVIVFVGIIYQFGGLDDFIRQFPEVIRQVPEAKLLIVGGGPPRPRLERIIAELGLEGHVIITGYQPFETMPQYINLASLCINVFPINDTTKNLFSAKIIQYMACGKATISTALPGITTLLPGESCGVIYANTAADMANEVVRLLNSDERREQLGQAGLDYVRREHSYDRITRQLEAYLEEAVREKQGYKRPQTSTKGETPVEKRGHDR
jgi:glycosyltransferase involved in cell wall biosynthesis